MAWDWQKFSPRKPSSGGQGPLQFDKVTQAIKKIASADGHVIAAAILVLLLGFTSFYTVNQDEVGVVLRFGRYVETTQPGLNFKLPVGIDSVTKVNVRSIQTEEFGAEVPEVEFRGRGAAGGEGIMLTGDLNVAVAPWVVQYRIKDPYNFLFKVADARKLMSDMSQAIMRLVVGDRSINEVISKREELSIEVRALLQRELDRSESGLQIVTIEMKKTNVPPSVQPAFNEVNQATQEKERLIYQARGEYNKLIPAARGEADRTIREAEGYAIDRVNRAKGDAVRFREIYVEYQKAKEVTEERLYLERMRDILKKIGPVYIVDSDLESMLPMVDLTKPVEK